MKNNTIKNIFKMTFIFLISINKATAFNPIPIQITPVTMRPNSFTPIYIGWIKLDENCHYDITCDIIWNEHRLGKDLMVHFGLRSLLRESRITINGVESTDTCLPDKKNSYVIHNTLPDVNAKYSPRMVFVNHDEEDLFIVENCYIRSDDC